MRYSLFRGYRLPRDDTSGTATVVIAKLAGTSIALMKLHKVVSNNANTSVAADTANTKKQHFPPINLRAPFKQQRPPKARLRTTTKHFASQQATWNHQHNPSSQSQLLTFS
eukprot:Plantae.Rhodophyta-Palmaria_palmata.ctg20020.p1 GENE.Plantae.Rhodophyta-Palmaria_palmata.ctg20020~~Plantae.Rhodophyta-Palmaria_palmata.ctg20020.p1  ORF type:complete len:111 (-),score=1.31 Plantae.Rhodophyta-Palmaria_palmata.ctg20020:189-521(-)